jgi:phosphohistidine phosphatase
MSTSSGRAPARLRGPGGRFLPAAAKAAGVAAGKVTMSAGEVAISAGKAAISAGKAVIAAGPKPSKEADRKPNQADGKRSQRGTTTADDAGAVLQLLFIRHADAGDSAAWQGNDAERPLSKKGRRQSRRLGDLLATLKVRPDALLTSPKVRAADTAKLVGRRVGAKPIIDARLGGGFDGSGLAQLIGELPAGTEVLALVGHDPDFSAVVSLLTAATIELPKGALARVDLPDRTARAGGGELRWLLPPDVVAG